MRAAIRRLDGHDGAVGRCRGSTARALPGDPGRRLFGGGSGARETWEGRRVACRHLAADRPGSRRSPRTWSIFCRKTAPTPVISSSTRCLPARPISTRITRCLMSRRGSPSFRNLPMAASRSCAWRFLASLKSSRSRPRRAPARARAVLSQPSCGQMPAGIVRIQNGSIQQVCNA